MFDSMGFGVSSDMLIGVLSIFSLLYSDFVSVIIVNFVVEYGDISGFGRKLLIDVVFMICVGVLCLSMCGMKL